MKWYQKTFRLPTFSRGFHLITDLIVTECPEISKIEIGICQVFIKHTSASLTINENADSTVRADFESHMNRMVPENAPHYTHTYEGPDDMPAHIKASLLGASVQIPITHGRLNLGVWQGVYMCEHRDHALGRDLVLTISGTLIERVC
ncbi:secondary thiamine-phosphate synthase enzyme YjbQ [Maribacter antarcticus]|uniref:secondary thiamine-phosphate synthase enzyme YjbQ n=1 Tax=Maribacter antarcticus TaxID=505250 RepID=UPI00056B7A5E|nr:secondary thiamine-phosphate synthase enzyme YjbQ [Maribacter antarcticus]